MTDTTVEKVHRRMPVVEIIIPAGLVSRLRIKDWMEIRDTAKTVAERSAGHTSRVYYPAVPARRIGEERTND